MRDIANIMWSHQYLHKKRNKNNKKEKKEKEKKKAELNVY